MGAGGGDGVRGIVRPFTFPGPRKANPSQSHRRTSIPPDRTELRLLLPTVLPGSPSLPPTAGQEMMLSLILSNRLFIVLWGN